MGHLIMSIKNKLKRMKPHLNTGQPQNNKPVTLVETSQTKEEIPYLKEWKDFGAHPFFTEDGYCLIRETVYPLNHIHGHYSFSLLPEIVNMWNEKEISHPLSAKGFSADQMFFFDTETTGLGGGAGTSIFLLGYAFLEGNCIKVRQHFLPRPGFEIPFYQTFLQSADYETLVTYNGKAFDWPQVVTHHTLLREHLPKLPSFGHFDLYHASRRLWKNKLDRVKLSVVEEEVLGFKRLGDVPGYLAPIIYFDYVERQDPEGIFKIIKHNEWDVLSLITLYIHLSALLLNEKNLKHADYFEIARWFSSLKESEQAIHSFENGLRNGGIKDQTMLKFHLAMEHKKNKNYSSAVPLWEESANSPDFDLSLKSRIELAKYYEHQVKDIEVAIKFTSEALEMVEVQNQPESRMKKHEILHRLERLERKFERRNEPYVKYL